MTQDRSPDRRDAHRVAEALGDLFDSLPPVDRTAAEDELRDAGLDPARIAARITRLATGGGRESDTPVSVTATLNRDCARRHYAVDVPRVGTARRRLWRSGTGLMRIAAVLILGIGIGWAAARIALPPHGSGLRVASDPGIAEPTVDSGSHSMSNGYAVNAGPRRGFSRDTRPRQQSGSAAGSTEDGVDNGAVVTPAAPADTGRDLASAAAPTDGAAEPMQSPEDVAVGDEAAATDGGDEDAAPTSWTLAKTTWQRGKDLLPGPIVARVRSGASWFPVQEVRDETYRAHYSDAFWAQSLANGGRLTVDPATCSISEVGRSGFPSSLRGLPFPTVAANDPTAACEVMWNVVAAQSIVGAQSGALVSDYFDRGAPPQRNEAQTLFGAYLAAPATGTRNPEDSLSATLLHLTSAAKVDTTFLLTRRYIGSHEDEFWIYTPSLRRVRRPGAPKRYTASTGSLLTPGDVNCFDFKVEEFQWRVLNQQRALAPIIGSTPTKTRITGDGESTTIKGPITAAEQGTDRSARWHFVENLTTVPRPVWVIEGTPRTPSTEIGKVVLYIDAAMYRLYWKLVYGLNGDAKDVMCAQQWWRTRDGSVGLATTGAMSIVDQGHDQVLLVRYTSQKLNFVPPDLDAFTIRAMIEAAQ